MNKFHEQRRIARNRAAFTDVGETMTDQSQAHDTDINVIVKRYGVFGQAPGIDKEPIYGDFSDLPTDLRGFIEMGRTLDDERARLPEPLREMSMEELFALTPEKLTEILTPPATKPAEGETKS